MGKVRFSCPRCKAVMQTNEDKIGYDINCPQCQHRFTLVGQKPDESSKPATDAKPIEETRQWVDSPVERPVVHPPATDANVAKTPRSNPRVDNSPSVGSIPPIYQGSTANFSCPYCRSSQPPIWKSEVSTAGWITCVILGCTTCFFFWVGFLIRDKYTVCSSCKARLPRPFL